jgi:hypothetical protein
MAAGAWVVVCAKEEEYLAASTARIRKAAIPLWGLNLRIFPPVEGIRGVNGLSHWTSLTARRN